MGEKVKVVLLADEEKVLIGAPDDSGNLLRKKANFFCLTCGANEVWKFSDDMHFVCGKCGFVFKAFSSAGQYNKSVSKVLVNHVKNLPKSDSYVENVNFFDDSKVGFEEKLTKLINQHSLENECDIPDHIMAHMIMSFVCNVLAFNKQVLDWHGCDSVTHPKPK